MTSRNTKSFKLIGSRGISTLIRLKESSVITTGFVFGLWHSKVYLVSACQRNTINKISSFQSLSHVRLFETPWTEAYQASLSITLSQSLLKLMSIELVLPSNHLILCRPLLLLPSIFPSMSVFSNESLLCIRWPKYWSFSFSISSFNEYSGLISLGMDWLDFLAVQCTLKLQFNKGFYI